MKEDARCLKALLLLVVVAQLKSVALIVLRRISTLFDKVKKIRVLDYEYTTYGGTYAYGPSEDEEK